MKFGIVTKVGRRNKTTSKEIIIIFPIYGTVTFYLTKAEKITKNIQHSSHTIALSKGTISAKKS